MPLSRKENRGTEIFVLPSTPLPRRGLLDASLAMPHQEKVAEQACSGDGPISRRIGSHTFYILTLTAALVDFFERLTKRTIGNRECPAHRAAIAGCRAAKLPK
jgi:hypothetical protein